MYTVLTGQKKNIGDFIITQRCRVLLKHHRPDRNLFQLPHWESLEDNLDRINQGKALIIMGGPGYQPGFYPHVYKFTKDINKIKVPVIPMGLGWKGAYGSYSELDSYRFTSSSLELLKRISSQSQFLGCRDYFSVEVLKRHGIENGLMTGCPVWYHLDSIGKKMSLPHEIKKVVFTPAQKHILQKQSITVMETLAELFPEAKLYCSFHRGLKADDEFTPSKDEKNNRLLQQKALENGFEVVDTSFNLDRIKFYDNCDLHVGYRVHGHLYFLSKRKPSFLIHEDGRGTGVSQALNLKGVEAFEKGPGVLAREYIKMNFFDRIIRKLPCNYQINPYTVKILKDYISQELESNFARFRGFGEIIDAYYPIMIKFIKSLP
ncbi:MAG: polysaccharide pyruvyl transferase family protein [Deltaproteobacteria bacterium]|jgi:hypothetical protein|nr:polysaccharide pyruvyl transferase family protein [Deltaproteobacteria bacterium]